MFNAEVTKTLTNGCYLCEKFANIYLSTQPCLIRNLFAISINCRDILQSPFFSLSTKNQDLQPKTVKRRRIKSKHKKF